MECLAGAGVALDLQCIVRRQPHGEVSRAAAGCEAAVSGRNGGECPAIHACGDAAALVDCHIHRRAGVAIEPSARQRCGLRHRRHGVHAGLALDQCIDNLECQVVRVGSAVVADADHRGVVIGDAHEAGLVAGPKPVVSHRSHTAMQLDAQAARVCIGLSVVERRHRAKRVRQRGTPDPRRGEVRVPQRQIRDRRHKPAFTMERKIVPRACPGAVRRGDVTGRQTQAPLRPFVQHAASRSCREGRRCGGPETRAVTGR